MPNQPRFRHVHLDKPTEYEIDVFAVNQEVAHFISKFETGWSATRHWLEPAYHHATAVVDGPPPPWWPDTLGKGIPSPLVVVTEQTRNDGGKRLIARCTLCGARTWFDALIDHPSLPNINWPMLSRAIEARFDGRQLDLGSLRREEEVEIAAILSNLVPTWRRELQHRSNGGCTHA